MPACTNSRAFDVKAALLLNVWCVNTDRVVHTAVEHLAWCLSPLAGLSAGFGLCRVRLHLGMPLGCLTNVALFVFV